MTWLSSRSLIKGKREPILNGVGFLLLFIFISWQVRNRPATGTIGPAENHLLGFGRDRPGSGSPIRRLGLGARRPISG